MYSTVLLAHPGSCKTTIPCKSGSNSYFAWVMQNFRCLNLWSMNSWSLNFYERKDCHIYGAWVWLFHASRVHALRIVFLHSKNLRTLEIPTSVEIFGLFAPFSCVRKNLRMPEILTCVEFFAYIHEFLRTIRLNSCRSINFCALSAWIPAEA